MPISAVKEIAEGRLDLVPITLDRYHRMIEAGGIPEDHTVELLGGVLVRKDRSELGGDPMSVGNRHRTCQNLWIRHAAYIESFNCYLGVNTPVAIPPDYEPEPDCTIIYGTVEETAFAVPTAAEVECIVEISDSSLRRDRKFKLSIYAEAGFQNYVVMNLVEDVVEHCAYPSGSEYTVKKTLRRGEQLDVTLSSGQMISIAVDSILPPSKAG